MPEDKDFPLERLKWMDDILSELAGFAATYRLEGVARDITAARLTLRAEAAEARAVPDHPIFQSRRTDAEAPGSPEAPDAPES